MQQFVKDEFIKKYSDGGEINIYFAPGRVNLIGEHTDYNGGYVFPCALSFGTYAAVRFRNDTIVRFATTNFPICAEVNVGEELTYNKELDWVNCPLGVINEFKKLGFKACGMDIMFAGNVPNGAGLSSSASLEVAMAIVLNDVLNAKIDMVQIALLCQRAENKFVGVNCGIMDQFAVAMGKKDNAMLLNCNTMDYAYVPVKISGCKLVISNTNKRRGLADSKYNERRSQCEKAVEMLQANLKIELLGNIDANTFETNKHLITDEIILKRATHVIYENDRTLRAVDLLKANDIVSFGKLLNASHDSLKDLYEVTGIELDTLVEEARKIDGVYGSRMTGAGFGGCTISIVKDENIDEFIKTVGQSYKEKIGIEPSFYIAEVGQGASKLEG